MFLTETFPNETLISVENMSIFFYFFVGREKLLGPAPNIMISLNESNTTFLSGDYPIKKIHPIRRIVDPTQYNKKCQK